MTVIYHDSHVSCVVYQAQLSGRAWRPYTLSGCLDASSPTEGEKVHLGPEQRPACVGLRPLPVEFHSGTSVLSPGGGPQRSGCLDCFPVQTRPQDHDTP